MEWVNLWDSSGWDTSDKEKETMVTQCCHINAILKHSMQNETLIERLWSLSTSLRIQIGSD